MHTVNSGQLRVLAVTNMYPTDGDPAYGAFVRSQMESVAALGLRVELELIAGRQGAWQYARAVPRVRRRARSGAFDLVHAHYGLSGVVAAVQPLPLVISFCGDDLLGTPDGRGGITPKSRALRWLSQAAARRADAVICKSTELRDALPRLGDRLRAWVIPNGVDVDLFSPGSRTEARGRLGLDQRERLVLFPHTPNVARKRADLAQDAIRELAGQGCLARLLLVSRVPQTVMPDYYRAADCLLLTSDQEGSPNTVKEALCCDLPVVTVDTGDVRRWLALAPGCRLVSRDPRAIAEALAQVLFRDRRVDGSGVRSQIGLPAIAQQLVRVYQEAIGHNARRAR